MTHPRYAVVPSNGRSCLDACIDALRDQVDYVALVKTKDIPRWEQREEPRLLVVQGYRGMNISRWWNNGLDAVNDHVHRVAPAAEPGKWDVAIINDDVIVPKGWFDAVAGTMRQMGVAAASSGGASGMSVLHTRAAPVPLDTRMQGFAFITAGELGFRFDERFVWYCGDDDFEWSVREQGGVVMIPGFHVQHLFPNGQITPELQAQTAKDMQSFVDKWGRRPW